MKTKVRIVKTSDPHALYQHVELQFLAPRWKDSECLEVQFSITFQADPGREYWYALNYLVNTEYISKIEYALKIARIIDKGISKLENVSRFEITPDNILQILKPELYGMGNSTFLPLSMNGCNAYDIRMLNKPDSVWKRIFAWTLDEATKMAKAEGIDNCTISLAVENISVIADSTECPYKKK